MVDLKGIVFFVNSVRNTKTIIFITLLILLGCQSGLVNETDRLDETEGYSPLATDKLFVVDCLLPGQLRKLGSQVTY